MRSHNGPADHRVSDVGLCAWLRLLLRSGLHGLKCPIGKIAQRSLLLSVVDPLDDANRRAIDSDALRDKCPAAIASTNDGSELPRIVFHINAQTGLSCCLGHGVAAGLDAESCGGCTFNMVGQIEIDILGQARAGKSKEADSKRQQNGTCHPENLSSGSRASRNVTVAMVRHGTRGTLGRYCGRDMAARAPPHQPPGGRNARRVKSAYQAASSRTLRRIAQCR